jgi:type IV pilus biogenesis protein CpaD/CtpE
MGDNMKFTRIIMVVLVISTILFMADCSNKKLASVKYDIQTQLIVDQQEKIESLDSLISAQDNLIAAMKRESSATWSNGYLQGQLNILSGEYHSVTNSFSTQEFDIKLN